MATNSTLKHCALGVLLAFVFGVAYIFEMRLNTLYKEGQKREEELSLMKEINNDLKMKVNELERKTIVSTDSIQMELSHMKEFMDGEQKLRTEQLTGLEREVKDLAVGNQNLLKMIEDSSKKVAFTAGATGPGGTGSGSTIVFPVVISNEGGGYNPSTGVFTAPTSGQYVFFVSGQGYSSSTLYVSIVHNGGAKVMTMSDGGRGKDFYDSGSNLVTLKLEKGDKVWVMCHSGSNYYSEGIPITTFSGFMT